MKIVIWMAIVLSLAMQSVFAQKLDSILSRSNLSFSYGVSHDYLTSVFLINGKDNKVKSRGEAFGFEYLFRPAGKNEFGFGFSKQVNSNDYTAVKQTPHAFIDFEDYRIRKTKNFHYLLYKRHFIEEKLIGAAGIYNLRYRDPYIQASWANIDTTDILLDDAVINTEFGVFVGLEYYHSLRENFQVGLRTRLFYTQGYDESFESFELTPVLRFTFK
ncbi:MAG: hypothetical protein FJZ76_01355 [Bacteroidetes bacterium]|nr:hypothetical protein [Bacteroidota bacterium]